MMGTVSDNDERLALCSERAQLALEHDVLKAESSRLPASSHQTGLTNRMQ
jgi:hypothetical protein